tara:strand:+ start:4010 stop:4408 length:399 start_codon:yes stop_codon:yes gene_type:complete
MFGLAAYGQSTEGVSFAIVTFNVEMGNLRSNQVKMLYRGRLSHINGIPARLMDLPKSSNLRNQFYKELLNKSPSQMSAIWAKQTFSGKALAPFEIKNESKNEITSWLKHNENGVAYVPTHLIPEDAYVIYQM